jgi:hypothetical protein
MGWVVNATPRPLYPRESDPVHTVQEARRAARPVWKGAENLAPTRIRSPYRPARIESLYRLRYPDPHCNKLTKITSFQTKHYFKLPEKNLFGIHAKLRSCNIMLDG